MNRAIARIPYASHRKDETLGPYAVPWPCATMLPGASVSTQPKLPLPDSALPSVAMTIGWSKRDTASLADLLLNEWVASSSCSHNGSREM